MTQTENSIAVGYRRVSTDKQERSGLGLEDQDRAISEFCARHGLKLDKTFTERESGCDSGRPELAKAIARVSRLKGILVIHKLDRLGRDVHFISGLMKTGVDFVCVDAPDDGPFITHLKASFAEEEALKISQRTKAAMAALRARGMFSAKLGRIVTFGNPANLKPEHQAKGAVKGAAKNKALAQARHAELRPEVIALRDAGKSLRAIAAQVGISLPTVQRILKG